MYVCHTYLLLTHAFQRQKVQLCARTVHYVIWHMNTLPRLSHQYQVYRTN